MDIWLALAAGIFIGCMLSLTVYMYLVGKWYVGDLREDRSTGDEQPYYFMEIASGAMNQVRKNKYVLLRVKLEDYLTKNTNPVMGKTK